MKRVLYQLKDIRSVLYRFQPLYIFRCGILRGRPRKIIEGESHPLAFRPVRATILGISRIPTAWAQIQPSAIFSLDANCHLFARPRSRKDRTRLHYIEIRYPWRRQSTGTIEAGIFESEEGKENFLEM